MSTHTPGPWEVKAVNGKFDAPRLYPVTRGGNMLMRGGFCRSEADANLIAAAPELLAALREMDCSGVLDSGMSETLARQARAAIAKAEGQS